MKAPLLLAMVMSVVAASAAAETAAFTSTRACPKKCIAGSFTRPLRAVISTTTSKKIFQPSGCADGTPVAIQRHLSWPARCSGRATKPRRLGASVDLIGLILMLSS